MAPISKLKKEAFVKNPKAQLDFIYKNAPHYEEVHLQLSVFKIF
jgi:hypothetical protein